MFSRSLADVRALGVCLVLATAAHAQVQAQRALAAIDPRRDCGTYCTSVVLERLGQSTPPFAVLREELRTDADGFTNLANIADALRARGLSVRVEDADRCPNSLCIAPMKVFGGDRGDVFHFVVLEPVADAGELIVYFPPVWAARQTWSGLAGRIGGRVLVVEEPARVGLLRAASLLLAACGGLTLFFGGRLR